MVALLAEGVDRNVEVLVLDDLLAVALLAEGVDRNGNDAGHLSSADVSPSSRRAWIEISNPRHGQQAG